MIGYARTGEDVTDEDEEVNTNFENGGARCRSARNPYSNDRRVFS